MADDISGLLSNPAFVEALGGPDTVKQLSAYLGLIGPQQSDLDKIDKDKWLNLGFGLLQGRKGDEFGAIGRAGMNALQTANQERTQLQAQRGQTLTQAMGLLQMAKANQSLRLKQQQMDENAAAFGGQPPQGQPPVPPQPQGPPAMGALGGASPVPPPGMTTTPPAQLPSPPQAGAPPNDANAYRQLAKIAAKYGDAESAKKYSDVANSLDAEFSPEPRTVMVDGKPTLVLVDKRGNVKPMTGMTPADKLVQVDTGGKIAFANPYSGNVEPGAAIYDKTQTPDSKASNALGYANLAESKRRTNMEYGLDESGMPTGSTDKYAEMIAKYEAPFPTTIMYRRPEMGAQIMAKVNEINPNYDTKNYPVAQATMTAFAKGKQGDTVRFIGNTLQHMDVLRQAATALNNGDYPLLNKLANAVGTQAGSSAPTTYNAIAGVVGNEVVKAVVGSGGGVGDREKSQHILADFNNPATLSGVLGGYQKLLGGQLAGLEQQYKAGTQRDDFAERFLTPETQKLRTSQGGAASAGGKTIVREGTEKGTGRRVVQYSDGTKEYR